MGDFNVACSVSNISIGGGDKVVFIPLLPSKNYDPRKGHRVEPASMLIYADCYFTPFSLPIRGEYDTYGSLDNIVQDENVKAIEKLFGIKIKAFIDIIGEQREWTSYVGDMFKTFMLKPKLLSEYKVKFDKNFMLELGFVEKENGRFSFEELEYEVELFASEEKHHTGETAYRIYDKEGTCVVTGSAYDAREKLLQDFRKFTGYFLNVAKENHARIAILEQLSGMFVLEEIYEKLAQHNLDNTSMLNNYLSTEVAEVYGFKEVPADEQRLFDSHHRKLYRKEGFPYDLKIGSYGSELIHQKFKEYYLFGDKRFGKEIRRDWEAATKTKPEDTFPEPQNIGSMTDAEYEKIKEVFKELVGSPMGYTSTWNDKHSIYSIKQFKEVWQKVTGEELNVSIYDAISKYDVEYDKFRMKLVEHAKKVIALQEKLKKTEGDKETKMEMYELNSYDNPFSRWGSASRDEFISFFEKWTYFENLYKTVIIVGGLKEEFKKYRAFYWTMYSCNRFFFPAMNGEQYGNQKASRVLLETSLEIVNRKIKEDSEEEEWDEDEE